MSQQTKPTVVLTDAEYDEELRFAGAGVLRSADADTEYQYPPEKWVRTSADEPPAAGARWRGAPYVVAATDYWPDTVERRLAEFEARIAALEAKGGGA